MPKFFSGCGVDKNTKPRDMWEEVMSENGGGHKKLEARIINSSILILRELKRESRRGFDSCTVSTQRCIIRLSLSIFFASIVIDDFDAAIEDSEAAILCNMACILVSSFMILKYDSSLR